MSLTITIPDEFADVLGVTSGERNQQVREALAIELYREGRISLRRMGELAGVGREYWEAEEFRARHKVPLNYSLDDLAADAEVAARVFER
jgi:predicted HTH domain antitoxin